MGGKSWDIRSGTPFVAQTFSAVLLLKRKSWLDPHELITDLRLMVEQTGADVRLDPRMIHQGERPRGLSALLGSRKPPQIMFELDGVRIRITQEAEPAADERAIHRYINPALWAEGLGEFTAHRAFVRIDEAGIEGEEGPDAVFDRAAAVTATASVVSRLCEPVGVIWLPACNAVPMQSFREGLDLLMKGGAPLETWVRWYAVPPGDKQDLQPGAITSGFAAFTGREIRFQPSHLPTRAALDYVFEFARRQIDERMALSDTQTITMGDGTDLTLKVLPPGGGSDSAVCELSIEGRRPALQPVETEADPEELRMPMARTADQGPRDLRPVPDMPPPQAPAPSQQPGAATAARIRVIPGGKRGR